MSKDYTINSGDIIGSYEEYYKVTEDAQAAAILCLTNVFAGMLNIYLRLIKHAADIATEAEQNDGDSA